MAARARAEATRGPERRASFAPGKPGLGTFSTLARTGAPSTVGVRHAEIQQYACGHGLRRCRIAYAQPRHRKGTARPSRRSQDAGHRVDGASCDGVERMRRGRNLISQCLERLALQEETPLSELRALARASR